MKTITYIDLENVFPAANNPRKTFNEEELKELAASIKEKGVIQPVVVRPLDTGGYEIVCGERRYRASAIAGQKTIPAVIRKLTDDEALDMAITENLQRKDVDPLEEAAAFKILVGKGQFISDLAARFGKSDLYIRGRLKLNDLIHEFTDLIREGKINVSQGLELCKYGKDLQLEVFNKYYNVKGYFGSRWNDISVKELKGNLQNYRMNLEDAAFDKTDCFKCPDNTGYSCLFPELEKVSCNNKACFQNKLTEYQKNEALRIFENEPEVILFVDYYRLNKDNQVVSFLLEKGAVVSCNEDWLAVHEIKKPEQPEREDYDGDGEEEYQDALKEHSDDLEEYEENQKKFGQDVEDGKIRKAFVVDGYSHIGEYLWVKPSSSKQQRIEKESGQTSFAVKLAELRAKDTRNSEIAFEKTLTEAKDVFTAALDENRHLTPMSELEEKMLYFHMLSDVRETHRKQFNSGSVYYMSDEEKFKVIKDLTEEKKVIILRDFLFAKISGSAYKKNQTGELFLAWMKAYEEKKIAGIELKHRETYLRRKEKIDASIAEIELENPEEK